ncbi:MAG: murein biosynthesis integral membrane protein MurJ [Candidatus Lernaella stagnicola]|nr:murein biosynthesis integral membrane protein MurJ [Candidatus Lernaella stagnicola]
MRYVLTGGGTGGHVYPNLAIASELARRDPEAQFLYIGVAKGAEADIVPRHGIPVAFVPSRGLPSRKVSFAMLGFLLALALGTLKSLALLVRYRPRLVVATGGYASAPALLAARLLRRPTLVHEQNAYPGLVNRTFGKLAGRVCVSFEESLEHFVHNGVFVGYPVRPEILACREAVSEDQRRAWKRELGIDPDRRVVLVTGGSLGARTINRAVADFLPTLAADEALRSRVFVMHGVGRYAGKDYNAFEDTTARLHARGFDESRAGDFYRREVYLYDIEKWLRVADAIVCRAGAGSLAETMSLGVPAVVIPKSGLPGDHQVKNAETMAAGGACIAIQERRIVEDGEVVDAVSGDRVLDAVRDLLDLTPERRAAMREAAASFVVIDCLTSIGDEADKLVAPPKPKPTRVQRPRTFLVDPVGERTEVLFDRSRVGAGRWDDVRLKIGGLRRHHFDIKRTSRAVNGRIDETWILIPRRGRALMLRRHGESGTQDVDGPTPLAVGDAIVLPGEMELGLEFETVIVSQEEPGKGAVENVFSQGVGTLGAKVMGFFREAFLGRFFGAGVVMDVFAVALSLANLMREVVAEMALENAFLPSFRLFHGRSDDKRPAWRLAWQVFNLFFVLSAGLATLGILTCPWWIHLVAPGFVDKGLISQTVAMTRLMFPFLVLMSISAFLGTLLQSFDRFGPNAFSPVFYSIGVIFSVLVLNPLIGMYSLGIGVLVGGALQIAFQLFFLLRRGLREKVAWNAYRPTITAEPGVKKVTALSGPIFIDATLNKAGGVVDKILATPLIAGSVSALYFSRILVVFPFSVLSMSINRVFLRDLADVAATGDAKRYRDLIRRGIEATLMLILPTTALMVVLAAPLVRVIFEGGAFTAHNTAMTSLALVCYALGLLGWSLTSFYSRVFSSQLDTRTSMVTNAGSLAVYLVFALLLVRTPLQHAGLALATSIGFTFNMVWRHIIVARRLAADHAPLSPRDLLATVGKTVVAGIVMVLVVKLVFQDPGSGHGFLRNLWSFGTPAVLGLAVFVAFAYLMRTGPLLELLNFYSARLGLGRPFGRLPVRPHHDDENLNVRALGAAALLAEARRREFNEEEMSIVRERLENYLAHDDWWIRNIGIKLIGALKLADRIDALVGAITEQAKKRLRLVRVLTGDARDVGFVRRNALTSLVEIGAFDARVRDALLYALDDTYWEVRQYALRAAIAFAEDLRGDDEVFAKVIERMDDRHFEVAPVAIRAYAELAVTDGLGDRLTAFLDHPRWPIRLAAVDACRRLFDRGVMTDVAELRRVLGRTLLAGEMVEPISPLKRALRRALDGLPEEP